MVTTLLALAESESESDPFAGGVVFVVGFVIVGVIGVIVAARLSRRDRE